MLNPSCTGSDHNSFSVLLSKSLLLFLLLILPPCLHQYFFPRGLFPYLMFLTFCLIVIFYFFAEEYSVESSLTLIAIGSRGTGQSQRSRYHMYSIFTVSRSVAALGRGFPYSLSSLRPFVLLVLPSATESLWSDPVHNGLQTCHSSRICLGLNKQLLDIIEEIKTFYTNRH